MIEILIVIFKRITVVVCSIVIICLTHPCAFYLQSTAPLDYQSVDSLSIILGDNIIVCGYVFS